MSFFNAERVWLAGIILALLLGLAGYRFQLMPRWEKLRQAKQEIQKTDADISQTQLDIQKINEIISELAKQQAQLEGLLSQLFPEKKVSVIIRRLIQDKTKDLKVDFSSITPQTIVTEGKVKKMPFTMNIKGQYNQILHYVNRLEKEPAIQVQQLNLNGAGGKPLPGQAYQLNGDLIFNALLMPAEVAAQPVLLAAEGITEPRAVLSKNDPFADAITVLAVKETAGLPKTPAIPPEDLPPTFQLQGVWVGANPKAFINDEVLGLGEAISYWKISEIKDGGIVVVNSKGKKFPVQLPPAY